MKRDYLGDSYDAVKRQWQQLLAEWAPLYAEPRFFPEDLQKDFTRLTGIPMLTNPRPSTYSLLNDPDTGIRLPGKANQAEGRTHISIASIADQLKTQGGPRCVVTFDQSDYRNSDLKRNDQRMAKLRALSESGVSSFYYVSHAPFLFAFENVEALEELHSRLVQGGIPKDRFKLEGPNHRPTA